MESRAQDARPSVERLYSIGEGGRRRVLRPADVDGRYVRLRRRASTVLVAVLVVLPFIEVRGYPAIWLDIARRRFHFFGTSLGPADGYLLFFLLSGIGFALIVASALWGRVWCGFACPQTVFLEGVFRRVERFIDGSRDAQMRREHAPWTAAKLARSALKYGVFAALSLCIAHVVLAYFVSAKELWTLMRAGPRASPVVFVATTGLAGLIFFDFAWFREQLCIVICPYGRLQSALCDQGTIVVGYDQRRGEPRGKLQDAGRGACVDCGRCVAVCPTGIDIRQGMQLECVGCANCIDACDEVMTRVKRPIGLIRYDSERGFREGVRQFVRPRVWLYAVMAIAGLVALAMTTSARTRFSALVLRQPGAPYVVDGAVVRNGFVFELENRGHELLSGTLSVVAPASASVVLPQTSVHLEAFARTSIPFFLEAPPGLHFSAEVRFTSESAGGVVLAAPFVGPNK